MRNVTIPSIISCMDCGSLGFETGYTATEGLLLQDKVVVTDEWKFSSFILVNSSCLEGNINLFIQKSRYKILRDMVVTVSCSEIEIRLHMQGMQVNQIQVGFNWLCNNYIQYIKSTKSI